MWTFVIKSLDSSGSLSERLIFRISSQETPIQENIRDNVGAPAETEDVDEEVDSKG